MTRKMIMRWPVSLTLMLLSGTAFAASSMVTAEASRNEYGSFNSSVIRAAPASSQAHRFPRLLPENPTWLYADKPTMTEWKKPGGSQNYLSLERPLTLPNGGWQNVDFDVTNIVSKMLAEDNTAFFFRNVPDQEWGAGFNGNNDPTPPRLTILTSTGTFQRNMVATWWMDPSAGSPIVTPGMHAPGILRPDLTDITGTLVSAKLHLMVNCGAQQVEIAYLDTPVPITSPAAQLGGVRGGLTAGVGEAGLPKHPSVIFYNAPTNDKALSAAWINYHGVKQFKTWPEFGNVAVVRVEAGVGPTATSWRRYFPVPQRDELWARYSIMVDPDYAIGFSDGVKLPGLGGTYDQVGQINYKGSLNAAVWEARLHHSFPSPGNQMVRFGLHNYYAGQGSLAKQPSAEGGNVNTWLKLGQKYSVEQHIKLNTQVNGVWQSDGIHEIFIDGVRVYQNLGMLWRANSQVHIDEFFHNVYQGGTSAPRAPIHWEVGPVVVATEYIGPLVATSSTSASK